MMETPRYRPGPYWPYFGIEEKCSKGSPYMNMHFRFHNAVRNTAMEVMGIRDMGAQNRKPVVCYMSRRLRDKRLRYFSVQLGIVVEEALESWAKNNAALIDFDKLEFDEKVPFAKQVERSSRCSVLFGTHGAGLGHQVWMPRGGRILEIGSDAKCHGYYEKMASWYGHFYTCISELKGHGVSIDKAEVYQSLNVTFLLTVLDNAVSTLSQ